MWFSHPESSVIGEFYIKTKLDIFAWAVSSILSVLNTPERILCVDTAGNRKREKSNSF
ncbi:hypothetical protein Nos7107_1304 [Nostoc sp. PCC 7107]|nr:hypothetical protein Nos7107_1304 [Nostoc sp. PCC 7107]